ncbi:MAG TPA: hypothetical protein VHN78_10950, partial [Chloroflexota bacterium]|nr:hypothetical protein [Chloroflexota bacterium]
MPPRATTRRGAGAPVESERGVVEATNEKGVKLNGRWLNYSQFHDVPHPEPGDEIEVEIARDRFINALNIVGGAERPAGSGGDVPLDLEDLPEDATPFDAE